MLNLATLNAWVCATRGEATAAATRKAHAGRECLVINGPQWWSRIAYRMRPQSFNLQGRKTALQRRRLSGRLEASLGLLQYQIAVASCVRCCTFACRSTHLAWE